MGLSLKPLSWVIEKPMQGTLSYMFRLQWDVYAYIHPTKASEKHKAKAKPCHTYGYGLGQRDTHSPRHMPGRRSLIEMRCFPGAVTRRHQRPNSHPLSPHDSTDNSLVTPAPQLQSPLSQGYRYSQHCQPEQAFHTPTLEGSGSHLPKATLVQGDRPPHCHIASNTQGLFYLRICNS